MDSRGGRYGAQRDLDQDTKFHGLSSLAFKASLGTTSGQAVGLRALLPDSPQLPAQSRGQLTDLEPWVVPSMAAQASQPAGEREGIATTVRRRAPSLPSLGRVHVDASVVPAVVCSARYHHFDQLCHLVPPRAGPMR